MEATKLETTQQFKPEVISEVKPEVNPLEDRPLEVKPLEITPLEVRLLEVKQPEIAPLEISKLSETSVSTLDLDEPTNVPSPHEAATYRQVLGKVPYTAYLLCVVELAERASFYGISGLLANFIQRPLPPGSTTGAPISTTTSQNAGALGLGITTSSAFTLLLTFLVYVIPLFGGYVADTRLGKFNTVCVGSAVGFFAHVFFVVAAFPAVIASGYALVPTVFGIVAMAVSSGLIRPNLAPLLMDQYENTHDVVEVLPTGEKVVVLRQKTLERMSLVYYWIINVGAFFLVATAYCARRIGYWLAFLVPALMYLVVPVVLVFLTPRLKREPPAHSAFSTTLGILRVAFNGNWFQRCRNGTFWEYAKPSTMEARKEELNKNYKQPQWTDQWVDDVRQTFQACVLFMYFPMFNLTDGGIGNAQNAQSGAMITKGIPNDLYNNFNALTIIVLIPILDYVVYPFMRRRLVAFGVVGKIALGFFLSATSQTVAAVLQHYIYKTSPCGAHASTCDLPSNVNGWWETLLYVLTGAGECFANITAYQVAYTHSPPQMKGVVLALFLFSFAVAAAVSEAVTACLVDPYLVRVFAGTAVGGYLFTAGFYLHFRRLKHWKK